MTCDPIKGCPPDTHNLHCGYPDCAKGKRERESRATPTETLVAELQSCKADKPLVAVDNMLRAAVALTTQSALIETLTRERDGARTECEEQARLSGMGAEREAALIARAEAAETALANARDKALEEACGRVEYWLGGQGEEVIADIRALKSA